MLILLNCCNFESGQVTRLTETLKSVLYHVEDVKSDSSRSRKILDIKDGRVAESGVSLVYRNSTNRWKLNLAYTSS